MSILILIVILCGVDFCRSFGKNFSRADEDKSNDVHFPICRSELCRRKSGRRQYRRESESTIKRHSIVMQLLFK